MKMIIALVASLLLIAACSEDKEAQASVCIFASTMIRVVSARKMGQDVLTNSIQSIYYSLSLYYL